MASSLGRCIQTKGRGWNADSVAQVTRNAWPEPPRNSRPSGTCLNCQPRDVGNPTQPLQHSKFVFQCIHHVLDARKCTKEQDLRHPHLAAASLAERPETSKILGMPGRREKGDQGFGVPTCDAVMQDLTGPVILPWGMSRPMHPKPQTLNPKP